QQGRQNMPHSAGMKTRHWIIGLFGVVTFAAISASASAAPISTMSGLTGSNGPAVTKVVEHQRRAYHTHKARQGRRFYGAATSDHPPPNSDWYPHDSNELPFGSARWWDQLQLETGGGR